MFEIVLNNKRSKYRDKPVMNIDVNDPCSWEEVKDKPETLENVEQRVNDIERKVTNISYVKSGLIPTSGWMTKTGYYEIDITVSGLDVTNASVTIDADTSDVTSVDDLTSINDSWNKILKIFATTNKLNVVATELPSIAIPLKIKVDRHIT